MKYLAIIILFLILSCTKNTCDEQLADALIQYNKALGNTGGSVAAVNQIKQQYEDKVKSIKDNCD